MQDPTEHAGPGASNSEIDLAAVVADLREEVRQLKASGRVPPGYEQSLIESFNRLVPSRGSDAELVRALQAVGAATMVRGEIPIHESRGMATLVKRSVRKLVAWYMNFIANQVSQLGDATFEALQLLAARYEEMLERSGVTVPAHVVARAAADRVVELSPWTELVVKTMHDRRGRILHMSAGRGEVLQALVDDGVDAYGVEPWGELADALVSRGLDVWADDPSEHLRRVGEGRLAGLVLSGIVDGKTPGEVWEILRLAFQKLDTGAALLVIPTTPEAWGRDRSVTLADLLPGRALEGETWRLLLKAAGFVDIDVSVGGGNETMAVTGVVQS